jgi:uncharacterized short protein YbdD (DUF466 family)
MTESVDQTLLSLPREQSLSAPWTAMRRGLQLTSQTLKLMIGVGDYDVYVKHMQDHHPDAKLMDYKEWYRNRVDARYGASKDGAMKRCPC